VISPSRGGDMVQYLASLERLRTLRLSKILPGHGDVIEEPRARIDEYLAHRAEREAQILGVLGDGPANISAIVGRLYVDTPGVLQEQAASMVQAHLITLRREGRVTGSGQRSAWTRA
jgi:hydroxyacylglutathione hydrolase